MQGTKHAFAWARAHPINNVGVIHRFFTCPHPTIILLVEASILAPIFRQAPSMVFVSMSELSARVSPISHIRLSTMRTPTLQRLACRSPSTLVGQVSVDAHARLSDATTVVSCVTNAPAEPIKCLGVTWPCSQTNFKRGYQQVYLI
jgi:hypothetical protein